MPAVAREKLAAMRKVQLFGGLATGELETLAASMERQCFRSSDVVFQMGEDGRALYFIVNGLVKISVPGDGGGQEAVLALLTDGEFFGELALIDGLPRSASAIAMEATETLTLSREEFLAFLQDRPGAAIAIMSVLSQRLRHTNGLIADSMFRDVPTRIGKKLLELAEEFGHQTEAGIVIDLRLRQQDVANMVGAARESINRCLMVLAELGLIKVEKQRITILDLAGLRAWVS